MHDALTRQLIALVAVLLLFSVPPAVAADSARQATILEQLQAAKLMQAVLAARDATPDEWRKLDETYAALIAKNPRDVTVRNARAEYFWDVGKQAEAVADWESALQIEPGNSLVLEHLGDSMLALGDVRKSAAYYSRAIASEPSNAAYHFALANVWFLFRHELIDVAHPDARSLLAGALAQFAEAARLAPGNAEYARAYAETFYSVVEPDWQAALAAWQNFRKLSPQEDFALLNLARVHLKLGQRDAAQACLSQVQNPDYQKLKSKLETQLNSTTVIAPKHPGSPTQSDAAEPRKNSSKPAIDAGGSPP